MKRVAAMADPMSTRMIVRSRVTLGVSFDPGRLIPS
jgi:hypothetical protein